MNNTILQIDASVQQQASKTRKVSQLIVDALNPHENKVIYRDLNHSIPYLDGHWAEATNTPAEQRSNQQIEKLAFSTELVGEIEQADTIVIGSPIYNFTIAASLKSWIDMVCRVGLTFKYTETGPVGLLKDKKVIIAIASGGTEIGSEIDFASNYLTFVFGFIGLKGVTIVDIKKVNLEKNDTNIKAQLIELI